MDHSQMLRKIVTQPGRLAASSRSDEHRARPCIAAAAVTRWHPLIITFGLALMALLSAGCAPRSGIQRASVGGEVTLDGTPVDEGSIRLIPVEGTTGPTSGAEIRDGEYYIARAQGPALGKYKVEVYAPRKTGKKIVAPWALQRPSRTSPSKTPKAGSSDVDASPQSEESTEPNLNPMQAGNLIEEWEEVAPPKYNEDSILELDVQSGHNTFAVHMKSE